MKFIFYISICLLFFGLSACQTSTNIYIVRHAEKSIVPADDPHLLPEGIQRAEALKDFLKNKNIGYIFSTNTNRTVETATPLSQEQLIYRCNIIILIIHYLIFYK